MTITKRDQQRERTRVRLLDATLHCLEKNGYSSTTTQRIQEEAGVSRGALLHHFSSKSALLVAAVHHIADRRLARLKDLAEAIDPDVDALQQLAGATREAMAGPPFQAALELWAAARTDTELREALLPAERQLGTEVRDLFLQHSGIEDQRVATLAYESLMAIVRGLEITRTMRSRPDVANDVVQSWLSFVRFMSSP